MKSNLFVNDKIETKAISHHIAQFRETDSNKLLQQKLSPLFHLKSIYTWVALLISYLANIWSRVRHVCPNYFDFRKIKPSLEYIEEADASMMAYPKASEKHCENRSVAELGDVEP